MKEAYCYRYILSPIRFEGVDAVRCRYEIQCHLFAGVPNAPKLDRVLRAAVALNLLAPGPKNLQSTAATYRNTAISAVLRDSEPHPMRSLMRMMMEECFAPYRQFVAGTPLSGGRRAHKGTIGCVVK